MRLALLKAFRFFEGGVGPSLETVGFKARLCGVDVNSLVQALIRSPRASREGRGVNSDLL